MTDYITQDLFFTLTKIELGYFEVNNKLMQSDCSRFRVSFFESD